MITGNLRKDLSNFLTKALAHATVKEAINNLKPELRNVHPQRGVHSVWEEFEHLRITQEDILRYTLDPNWKSPNWPSEYWPDNDKFTDKLWNESIKKFFSDLGELINLVNNSEIDLTSEIPHGEGRSYLRELLLVIDHNAYHCGQIVMVRKLLNDW
jgi:uncharacterized damage-inducible protein DinB